MTVATMAMTTPSWHCELEGRRGAACYDRVGCVLELAPQHARTSAIFCYIHSWRSYDSRRWIQ